LEICKRLYNIGFERQKSRLVELVETQAVMIRVIAQQGALLYKDSPIRTHQIAENTILKVANAHYQYGGFEKTGEFTLGKREGDTIQFLIKQRHFKNKKLNAVPWKSNLAEPMRRALQGNKGVDIIQDYRGAVVLAAYQPVQELGWGLVAKIDLSEVRAPYIKAAEDALGLRMTEHPASKNGEHPATFGKVFSVK
jgi:hypothetical protein